MLLPQSEHKFSWNKGRFTFSKELPYLYSFLPCPLRRRALNKLHTGCMVYLLDQVDFEPWPFWWEYCRIADCSTPPAGGLFVHFSRLMTQLQLTCQNSTTKIWSLWTTKYEKAIFLYFAKLHLYPGISRSKLNHLGQKPNMPAKHFTSVCAPAFTIFHEVRFPFAASVKTTQENAKMFYPLRS